MREGFRVLHRRVATWAPFSVSGACPSEQYLQADLQSGHIGIQQEIALSCIRPFLFTVFYSFFTIHLSIFLVPLLKFTPMM